MKIKRKDLEIFLQFVEKHPQPKLRLEQYPTPSRVAANLLWFAGVENNDIYNKTVLDLGCGTGILALGAAYLGAKKVTGIDISSTMLDMASKKAKSLKQDSKIEFIEADFSDVNLSNTKYNISIAVGFFDYVQHPGMILNKIHKHTSERVVAIFPLKYCLLIPLRILFLKIKKSPLFLFKRKEAIDLAKKSGFRIENINYYGSRLTLKGLILTIVPE